MANKKNFQGTIKMANKKLSILIWPIKKTFRGQVEVDTSGEAIETILTHTRRPMDLIRRKNVTKEVVTLSLAGANLYKIGILHFIAPI